MHKSQRSTNGSRADLFLWYPSAGRCRLQLGHRLPCSATEAASSALIAEDPFTLLMLFDVWLNVACETRTDAG